MRYIKKNFRSWLQFAEAQDYIVGLGDLILVTGHDTTRDYAMAAFANNNTSLRIAFQAGFSGAASAAVSVWGTWQTSPFVYHNCGPVASTAGSTAGDSVILPLDEIPPQAIPSGGHLQVSSHNSEPWMEGRSPQSDFAQCIFLRGYRMRERRPLSPTVISAAATGADRPGAPRDAEDCAAPLRSQDQERAEDSDNVSFFSDTTPVRSISPSVKRSR